LPHHTEQTAANTNELLLLALLVGNAAGSLASRLAGGLALAAAAA